MKIEHVNIKIGELVKGYVNHEEEGVYGYGGRLNIRPPYQREFVYKDKQREAVIDTVVKGFPLNTMYWAVVPSGFEIIDGQQRTISICQYINGEFSYQNRYFHNLQKDEKKKILEYQLTVYLCEGTDSDKLEWFKTINIAGEALTAQELRNAVYSGPWVTDAKRYFSKTNCVAFQIGSDYMSGVPIRQDYLETVIKWFSKGQIEGYMAQHQHLESASELWIYYQNVINWTKTIFPVYRREMKGLPWGQWYNKYKDRSFNPQALEEKIKALMSDDEVRGKKGIYAYILDGRERHLNLRVFTKSERRTMYERQNGVCALCQESFSENEMQADHIIPWSRGGKTVLENGQMLCAPCNREKSNN